MLWWTPNHKITSLILHKRNFSTIFNCNMNMWYESPKVETHSSLGFLPYFLRQVVLLHMKLAVLATQAIKLLRSFCSHSPKLGSICLGWVLNTSTQAFLLGHRHSYLPSFTPVLVGFMKWGSHYVASVGLELTSLESSSLNLRSAGLQCPV